MKAIAKKETVHLIKGSEYELTPYLICNNRQNKWQMCVEVKSGSSGRCVINIYDNEKLNEYFEFDDKYGFFN